MNKSVVNFMCLIPIHRSTMNDYTLLKYYLTSLRAREMNKNGLSFAICGRENMDFGPNFQS